MPALPNAPPSPFPRDFLWGVATSAYQIEGATRADGRGESIWDRFCARPGAIADGSSGADACAHYRLWRDDVALMGWLGVNAYRFSIAWPRVVPEGRGAVNGRGLDFYDRLVDELLAVGIEPVPTLYHWDLPQRLEDQGGWAARATAEAFVAYAEAVARRLGDRLRHVITHNEPWCVATLGYARGEHAPGRRHWPDALAAAHHLLLSHGWAVPALRQHAPAARVGITLNLTPATPASATPEDVDACREFDGGFNRWYLDPLHGRGYPEDVVDGHRRAGRLGAGELSFCRPGDLEAIAAPTDFLGVNYYTRAIVSAASADGGPSPPPQGPVTDMGWEVHPAGMAPLLLRLTREYRTPRLYITENGAAYATGPDASGRIRDAERVRYLHDHVVAVAEARAHGVPVAGYFAWSLLDNFEWAEGYRKRFGLVWVDYATQRRTPKDSAHWYRALAGSGRVPPPHQEGRETP
jgi:beta-glucosidase